MSFLLVGAGTPLQAQVQLSESFTLTQVVDGIPITLKGARPNARGRTIYGKVVKWETAWVAGANIPTTLEVGRDFKINGTAVPAGAYSLWIVARPEGDWSLRIDPHVKVDHWFDPDSSAEQFHARLKVTTVDPVETLTWSIPSVTGYRATFRMAWGDRAAEFTLALKPSFDPAVSAETAAALVGNSLVTADTTVQSFASPPPEIRISPVGNTLRFEALGMKGRGWDWGKGLTWMLVPVGGGLFTYGVAYEGELVELYKQMGFWEFQRKDGKVTGFEVRTFPDDKLWLTGRREP